MKLNELLKSHRENENMTQTDLAKKLFVTHQTISKWETGQNTPSIDNLMKLSDLYNISLDKLVRGSEFFKKPFYVGKPISKRKISFFLLFWLFLSLFFTGFGYLPSYVFIIVYCIGVFMVFPTLFNDYWIINKSDIAIKKYSNGLKKTYELLKTAINDKNERVIKYNDILSLSLEYEARIRLSPIDFYPDRFYLKLTLKDGEIICLPLTAKIEEYLPQFCQFLKKKNIIIIDANSILPILFKKQSVYEHMHQTNNRSEY